MKKRKILMLLIIILGMFIFFRNISFNNISYRLNKFVSKITNTSEYKTIKQDINKNYSGIGQEKVKNKETSWQELFERFDLYGKDDEIFLDKQEEKTEEKKEEKDDSMSSFLNLISGIDVDKISDGLNGMKKILNILSEITTGDEKVNFTSSRRNQKPYKRDDD